MTKAATPSAHERIFMFDARILSDTELFTLLLGPTSGSESTSKAAAALLETAALAEIAWATPDELMQVRGIGPARAAAIAAAFELGRRGAWSPPFRGDRVLDPERVYELLRHSAHAEREQFHLVCIDSRGCLIKHVLISEGSLTQCPVSPRDVIRQAIKANAHGVVFVHNHPSSATPLPVPMTSR